MVTPRFECTQDETHVLVHIHVPHVRVSEAEVVLDGDHLSFWCRPYLLRVRFAPGSVQGDDEACSATYLPDLDDGTIVTRLPKLVPGEHVPNLDLLTALLCPSTSPAARSPPTIEVLGSETAAAEARAAMPPEPPPHPHAAKADGASKHVDDERLRLLRRPTYGFNEMYSGVFTHLRQDLVGVVQLPDPEGVPAARRPELRRATETAAFDEDRYRADEAYGPEDPIFVEAVAFVPHWEDAGDRPGPPGPAGVADGSSAEAATQAWTSQEREQMRSFKNKEFLIDPANHGSILAGLLTIVLGYAYDHRTTLGEPTVESGWTVSMLSAALSWLEVFPSGQAGIAQALASGVRRMLVYPYLRSWVLATKIVEDACAIFSRGRRCLLRCMLQVHAILERSEMHYLLNKIFVVDYCVWLQGAPTPLLDQFAQELRAAAGAIRKDIVERDLIGPLGSESESGSESPAEAEPNREASAFSATATATDGPSLDLVQGLPTQRRSPLIKELN